VKSLWSVVAVCGVLCASNTATAQAPSGDDAGLELRAVRFFRAAGGQTVVDVLCQVPFGLLEPVGGPRGAGAYRMQVSVRDSTGLELVSQDWAQAVPAQLLRLPRASTVEHLSFAAVAGRYAVAVAITDSASGRVTRGSAEVTTFGERPRASDLLLGTDIRSAGAADTAVEGELRKGNVFIAASQRPVLTPQQTKLAYYLEVYADAPESVTVTMRVLRPDGSMVVAVAAQRLGLDAGGGATRGAIDLAGLPPGSYRLEALVARGDTVRRDAEFGMTGFETGTAIAGARAAEDVSRARDPFAAMTEAELDTLYTPLLYLMTAGEQGVYPSLTLTGKRDYLRQFWAKRDPTPESPRNEAQEEFYRLIAEANREFGEPGAAAIPGWRTDRGRIFVRYGRPDEVFQRPLEGKTNPYVVWKYTRNRPLKYVFMDLTNFGNYALIWTNDRREPSRPNWEVLLGPEATEEVLRY
jgi:GWxTD domain-containing protein